MRFLPVIAAALSLTACAPRYAVSHVQDYRPKGQDDKVSIQGALKVDPELFSDDYGFMVRLDGVTSLALNLDRDGNGELSCKAGQDDKYCKAPPAHDLSASCTGSEKNRRTARITCFVFLDGERAATFTFN